jgi:disease resistance protein RPM1
MECVERSHVRSLFFFTEIVEYDSLIRYFAKRIPREYRSLKVLDYDSFPLWKVPDKLGIMNHLKYLSFRRTMVSEVPKSIGMLHNLETLDLRNYNVIVLPKEISKLRKLRHLMGHVLSLVKLKDGIGEMTSLQTLHEIDTDIDGAVEVIKELGKLKQIRVLGLRGCVRYGSILSSSLNEMQHLEKLYIDSQLDDEGIDLNLISSPTMLQNLKLYVRLQKLPEWIPELQNLVVLRLMNSHLTKDPMESLKCLQHLLILYLQYKTYEGLHLHVEAGGFQKLKELHVIELTELQDIIIDKGALPSLKKLGLGGLPKMKHIPTGIKHLEKLEDIYISHMQVELVKHNSTVEWIKEHVPLFEIQSLDGNVVIRNSRG